MLRLCPKIGSRFHIFPSFALKRRRTMWPAVQLLTASLNKWRINPLNAELNPVCHLVALLGAHHILHVSRIRVKIRYAHPEDRRYVCWRPMTLPWLTRLIALPSLQRPGFNPRPVSVGFMVDTVTLGQVYFYVLRLFLFNFFAQTLHTYSSTADTI